MFVQRLSVSVILAGFLLAGCNSSDETNDSADNNFTILQGSVPGTLIEAFCEDGSYYHVNSTDDGSEEHPFSITIPKNLQCRLVMSTHEDDLEQKVITPIRVDTAQANSPVFYGVSDTADLGHIPLALNRSDINDNTNDGVSDDLLGVSTLSGTLVAVSLLNDPMDADSDGIINIYEDDDDDGISNHDDDDDDDNGIEDINDIDTDNDLDGDGIKNGDDIDDDNDGLHDANDDDDDNDGISDDLDDDDDNDGIDDDLDEDDSSDEPDEDDD